MNSSYTYTNCLYHWVTVSCGSLSCRSSVYQMCPLSCGLVSSVRDFEELVEMGLPIWTQFVRVRGATKEGNGRLNTPVTIGGNTIHPGDIVVMDADGAITVAPSRLDDILEKAEARTAKEAALRQRYKKGERSYDLSHLRELVETSR